MLGYRHYLRLLFSNSFLLMLFEAYLLMLGLHWINAIICTHHLFWILGSVCRHYHILCLGFRNSLGFCWIRKGLLWLRFFLCDSWLWYKCVFSLFHNQLAYIICRLFKLNSRACQRYEINLGSTRRGSYYALLLLGPVKFGCRTSDWIIILGRCIETWCMFYNRSQTEFAKLWYDLWLLGLENFGKHFLRALRYQIIFSLNTRWLLCFRRSLTCSLNSVLSIMIRSDILLGFHHLTFSFHSYFGRFYLWCSLQSVLWLIVLCKIAVKIPMTLRLLSSPTFQYSLLRGCCIWMLMELTVVLRLL